MPGGLVMCQSWLVTSGDSPQQPPAWLHIAIAGLVGACFTTFAVMGFLQLLFLGSLVLGAFFVVISPFVFQAVNRVFNGPTPGGWAFVTAAAWWAAMAVSALLLTADDDYTQQDRTLLVIVAAAVPMVITAMIRPGRLRRIGVAVGAAALAMTAVVVVYALVSSGEEKREDDRAQAIADFGSSVHPWVIGSQGYRQNGDPVAVSSGVIVGTFYRPETPSQMLTLTNDALTLDFCGPALRATVGADVSQPEVSCELVDDVWIRTSKGGHEAAVKGHEGIVRVAASNDVPRHELIDAVRSAKPMSDRYYRHLLFGEDVEYIPELDGAR